MEKNCAVQYATDDGRIYVDTDLITREEAEKIFSDNIEDFKEKMEQGRRPEIALWINMKDSGSYGETAKHWHADDMILKDGRLYELVEQG
jgi:hypothetical protein